MLVHCSLPCTLRTCISKTAPSNERKSKSQNEKLLYLNTCQNSTHAQNLRLLPVVIVIPMHTALPFSHSHMIVTKTRSGIERNAKIFSVFNAYKFQFKVVGIATWILDFRVYVRIQYGFRAKTESNGMDYTVPFWILVANPIHIVVRITQTIQTLFIHPVVHWDRCWKLAFVSSAHQCMHPQDR